MRVSTGPLTVVDPFDSGRESCCTLLDFFQECSIVDIWRSLNPNVMGFTWDKPDGSLSSRIDTIGCSYSWAPFVNSVSILPYPLSDHSSVVLDASIPESIPRGPGKWILNISTLNDADYVSSIKSFWVIWRLRKYSFSSLQGWWDRGKEIIKGITIKRCCKISRERAQRRDLLVNLASHLKCKVDAGFLSLLGGFGICQVSDCFQCSDRC